MKEMTEVVDTDRKVVYAVMKARPSVVRAVPKSWFWSIVTCLLHLEPRCEACGRWWPWVLKVYHARKVSGEYRVSDSLVCPECLTERTLYSD